MYVEGDPSGLQACSQYEFVDARAYASCRGVDACPVGYPVGDPNNPQCVLPDGKGQFASILWEQEWGIVDSPPWEYYTPLLRATAAGILTDMNNAIQHTSYYGRMSLGWEPLPTGTSRLQASAEAVFGLYNLASFGGLGDVRYGLEECNPIRVILGVVGVFGLTAGVRGAHTALRSATSTGRGLIVNIGTGSGTQPMIVVREIERGESLADLIDYVKQRTYESGNEHAIVRLVEGNRRAIVSGGERGIDFGFDINFLYLHSHPYHLPIQFASPADKIALQTLREVMGARQISSYLLEHGLLSRFYG